MNVIELRKRLLDIADNVEVILASDEEGNSFLPLREISEDIYSPKNETVHLRFLTPKDVKVGYTEEDLYLDDDGVECITLYP